MLISIYTGVTGFAIVTYSDNRDASSIDMLKACYESGIVPLDILGAA